MIDKDRQPELPDESALPPTQAGIFAVRNSRTGEVWVGVSRSLDTQKAGLWERLGNRMLLEKDIQASWNKHGKSSFSYAVLERVREADPTLVERLLPEHAAVWRTQLGAGVIKGV